MQLVTVLVLVVALVADARVQKKTPLLQRPSLMKQVEWMGRMHSGLKKFHEESKLKDMSVKCAICGIAVNEVLGLMLENRTVNDIVAFVKNDICSVLSGSLQQECNQFASDIPIAVNYTEHHFTVTGVCTEMKYCDAPFPRHNESYPVRTFTVDLDKSPEDRFTEICSDPQFKASAQYLVNTVQSILPDHGEEFDYLGRGINLFYMPTEYAGEIRGCASALGVPYGWVTLMNLGYELSDACTSIVARAPNGHVIHARNLDFWAGMGFTDSLKNMSYNAIFTKGGKEVFRGAQIAGFSGILTGMKKGGFSVTVNTRFYKGGIVQLFREVIVAIEEKNASLVTFLSRDVMQKENDFNAAVTNLARVPLIADVYYTVGGIRGDQGVVIARNRTGPRYEWPLDSAKGKWYTGVSNYDTNEPQPWYDDRWDPAKDLMNKMGPSGVSMENMYQVMSTKPVLNLQTTYTIIAVPANGTLTIATRYCPYPCTQ